MFALLRRRVFSFSRRLQQYMLSTGALRIVCLPSSPKPGPAGKGRHFDVRVVLVDMYALRLPENIYVQRPLADAAD